MATLDENLIARLEQLLVALREGKFDRNIKLGSLNLSDFNPQDEATTARLLPYLSPELLQKGGQLPELEDKNWQYIFAALLYEEIANGYYLILPPGVEPLSLPPLELASYIVAHPPVPRRRLPPLPPELRSWFARALHPNPSRRFDDVDNMLESVRQAHLSDATANLDSPNYRQSQTLTSLPSDIQFRPPSGQNYRHTETLTSLTELPQPTTPSPSPAVPPTPLRASTRRASLLQRSFRPLVPSDLNGSDSVIADSSGSGVTVRRSARVGLRFSWLFSLGALVIIGLVAFFLFMLVNNVPEVQRDWVTERGSNFIDKVRDVAVDSDNNLYVVSQGNLQILKYSPNGRLLKVWGGFGRENGRFTNLSSITLDNNGNVYVGDSGNLSLQKFDKDGQFLARWKSDDTAKPYKIDILASDQTNFIYAAAFNGSEILKFDLDGNLLARFGSLGTNEGQFEQLVALAVDKKGFVYTLDFVSRRVQKFDSAGKFVNRWESLPKGKENGQLNQPVDLTVDEAGNVYIADYESHHVQKYDQNGTYLATLGVYGFEQSQFRLPTSVIQDSTGNLYVGEQGNNRVQKFDKDGNFLAMFGYEQRDRNVVHQPYAVAVASDNLIYVVDNNNFRILRLDNKGNFIPGWGKRGSANGEFSFGFFEFAGITVDREGLVYVVDTYNHRVQKFDKSGNFILKWGSEGSAEEQFNTPSGIVADKAGNIYVADTFNHRIQKFDKNGLFISSFGTKGSEPAQFLQPNGLAVDSQNNLYVADTGNNRIQKFSSSGKFLLQFGTGGTGKGQFRGPGGLALDTKDNLYVADSANGRIEKFTANGEFVLEWGKAGLGDDEFNTPFGLAISSKNEIYIADSNGSRIQKYLLK